MSAADPNPENRRNSIQLFSGIASAESLQSRRRSYLNTFELPPRKNSLNAMLLDLPIFGEQTLNYNNNRRSSLNMFEQFLRKSSLNNILNDDLFGARRESLLMQPNSIGYDSLTNSIFRNLNDSTILGEKRRFSTTFEHDVFPTINQNNELSTSPNKKQRGGVIKGRRPSKENLAKLNKAAAATAKRAKAGAKATGAAPRRKVTKPRSKTQSSIYRGVSKCSKDGRWQARIRIGANVKYLGRFKTEIEAAKCYDAAAILYHTNRAVLNFKDETPDPSMAGKAAPQVLQLQQLQQQA